MKIDLYLNKKEKISKNFEKIINECVIWYPKGINDAVEELQALGLPAKEDNIIMMGNAGGVTIKSKVEQIKSACRVLDKRMKYLNNSMPLEAYYYYLVDYEVFYNGKYDSEIFKELGFSYKTIRENKERFKQIKKRVHGKYRKVILLKFNGNTNNIDVLFFDDSIYINCYYTKLFNKKGEYNNIVKNYMSLIQKISLEYKNYYTDANFWHEKRTQKAAGAPAV